VQRVELDALAGTLHSACCSWLVALGPRPAALALGAAAGAAAALDALQQALTHPSAEDASDGALRDAELLVGQCFERFGQLVIASAQQLTTAMAWCASTAAVPTA